MGIQYETKVIGEVRPDVIIGRPGVGLSELRFVLAWNIYPKQEDVFTVFGTSVWVSVMPEGEATPMMLGQAMPEAAWCEESRDGQPFDRQVMYRLTLPSPQLLALEQQRQGRGLIFSLDVRGNSYGPRGIRTVSEALSLRVNVSEWARVLKEANAADVLLVGVHLPVDGMDAGFRAAIDLVRRANEHLAFGHYTAAVAECRRAIESLWRAGDLAQEAAAARKALSAMREQMSMTKKDRELALGEAIRIFTHAAHHVGSDAEPEVFGRADAALVVGATAGLVSSLVASPQLTRSTGVPGKPVTASASNKPPSTDGAKPNEDVALSERIAKAADHFQKNTGNRPGTMIKLRSALDSFFGKKLKQQELDKVIAALKKRKVFTEAAGKLTYPDIQK